MAVVVNRGGLESCLKELPMVQNWVAVKELKLSYLNSEALSTRHFGAWNLWGIVEDREFKNTLRKGLGSEEA